LSCGVARLDAPRSSNVTVSDGYYTGERRMRRQRLFINVDHVATVRQARRGGEPDPVAAARLCMASGADGITAHLREDRRHIQDHDVERIAALGVPFCFEMACTDEMLAIALRLKPHECMFVPEKRQEVTTEGGLDVTRDQERLRAAVGRLNDAGIQSCLFIDADERAVAASHDLQAHSVELHTGPYAHHPDDPAKVHALQSAARFGAGFGLEIHAGHGLSAQNVGPIARIPEVVEMSIGHAVVGRSIFVGLPEAIAELRAVMDSAHPSS
jgi:pyridoxine 5-phosphate synthase